MRMIREWLGGCGSAVLILIGVLSVRAGNLDSPGAPTAAPASAMYTLEAIYNRLDTGAAGEPQVFTDPASGPAPTMHTLNEIMAQAPLLDAANGATAAQVLSGKTFWGLISGGWGTLTGTMPIQTLSAANDTVAAGYYAATTLSAVDGDLATANVRAGQTIFGVSGDANVVNTSSGDAVAAEISSGKKAWVDGAEVTGSAAAGANVTGAAGALGMTIPDGLYSGSKTATANDADLVTGNIRAGVNLFGVNGKTEVVDTTTGTGATAAEVVGGRTAYVNGAAVTGTRPLSTLGKTGQTTVYRTGDDGTYLKGVAPTGARFTNNGNGTVTDNLTGLMWAQNASLVGASVWNTAVDNCEVLSLGGFTDWRLPNRFELESLLDLKNVNPCLPTGHPFTGVVSSLYWSSTTYADFTTHAWRVFLPNGTVDVGDKGDAAHYVWPVRGGQ